MCSIEYIRAETELLIFHLNSRNLFQVVCPVMAEKSDWKLSGQAISLTMPLMESVSSIKVIRFELNQTNILDN